MIGKINDKLLYLCNNNDLDIATAVNTYLDVLNGILDYATLHNLHTHDELDMEEVFDDFVLNIVYDFDLVILNLSKNEYDLNVIIEYLDRLVSIINFSNSEYINILRTKTNTLFKLGKHKDGEKIMLDLINNDCKSIYPYMELVDDFQMVGNLEKSKYYYDLAFEYEELEDYEFILDRIDYFF